MTDLNVPRLFTFKTPEQERQFHGGKVDPLLLRIISEAVLFAFKTFRWAFVITEVWRSWEADKALGGSGVHPSWRAIDIRTGGVSKDFVDAVVTWVNARWVYDPFRPWLKVAYAKPHGTGPHIHFQVHSRTRMR